MEFGAVTVGEAAGAVLAHSVALPGGKLKKGTVLKISIPAKYRWAIEVTCAMSKFAPQEKEVLLTCWTRFTLLGVDHSATPVEIKLRAEGVWGNKA